MSNDNINDFLFGGSGKAAKFEEIGDTIEGIITDAQQTQQTHMETQEPLTWPDGSPRMQLVVTLQTELHDDDNDDGLRRIFAKGGRYEVAEGTGTSMKDAIADAVKKSGSKTFDVGGWLKVGFSGMGKKTNRGFSAPKLFRAQYKAPTASIAAKDLWDDEG
jgi:hypothetical protein